MEKINIEFCEMWEDRKMLRIAFADPIEDEEEAGIQLRDILNCYAIDGGDIELDWRDDVTLEVLNVDSRKFDRNMIKLIQMSGMFYIV